MHKKGCPVSLQGGIPNELIHVDGKTAFGQKGRDEGAKR